MMSCTRLAGGWPALRAPTRSTISLFTIRKLPCVSSRRSASATRLNRLRCRALQQEPSERESTPELLKLEEVLVEDDYYPDGTRQETIARHYQQAAARLEYLLAGVGDGYYEMFRSYITNMPPDLKALGWVCVTLCFGLGSYLPIYFLDCFLDFDPIAFRDPLTWGAFEQTCQGILAAVPLMALVWLAWRQRERVPVLKEMQQDEVAFHEPLVSGMSPLQLVLSAMSGAFAVQLVVLPGIFEHTRVLAALSEQLPVVIREELVPNVHEALLRVHLPNDPPSIAWALLPAGLIVAVGEVATHLNRLSDKEQKVIHTAIDNADRYYRVMHSTGEAGQSRDAEVAAVAFKTVARRMLLRGRGSAVLAGLSHTLLTVYLGAVYLWSGGFLAPAVASMLVNATHWRHLQAALLRAPQPPASRRQR